MNIGIDGNEANISTRVGVGWYAFNVLTALSRLRTDHQFHVFLKNPPLPDMPPATKNWHYHVCGPQKLWTRIGLPFHLYTHQYHLNYFVSLSHYSPLFCPCPTIPTIHDIGYLNSKSEFTKKDLYQLVNWTKESIQKAVHIFAVSEFTQNELLRTFHVPLNKISLTYNGVGEPETLSDFDNQQILKKYGIINPYFVAVGTLKPNKNYPFLIRSFSQYLQSNPDTQLVIAGKKGWLFSDIFNVVKSLHLENKVIFTDYISEKEKWSLLKQSICLVIPSTYEGFGIPAIEAQKAGIPVIASDIAPLREILVNSALFIDPTSEIELIQAFSQVSKDAIKAKLITDGLVQSAKFTWDNTAKAIIESLTSIRT